MSLLPNTYVRCDACGGRRFNRDTLEIAFRAHCIADVLALTVDDAFALFEHQPSIRRALEMMRAVGLGYLSLGQGSPTLSGGEAQRVKLVRELARSSQGSTLYVLDEPTTGLAMSDTANLVRVLHRLVDLGNTVVVIEHNMEVIREADYIIDLGPRGGDAGGRVVAKGHPFDLARRPGESLTAKYLKRYLRLAGAKGRKSPKAYANPRR